MTAFSSRVVQWVRSLIYSVQAFGFRAYRSPVWERHYIHHHDSSLTLIQVVIPRPEAYDGLRFLTAPAHRSSWWRVADCLNHSSLQLVVSGQLKAPDQRRNASVAHVLIIEQYMFWFSSYPCCISCKALSLCNTQYGLCKSRAGGAAFCSIF